MRSSEGDQRFFLLELDVLFDECIQKAVEGTLAGFGWNHILINNTGIHNVAPLAVVPMSTVEHVMSTNVYDGQWGFSLDNCFCLSWKICLMQQSTETEVI
ncbi:hypothetical protein MA16_Dca027418 [Dendrobium catenatum]|uniref:Uncharacterized protein n=1 Tax=Dendrobium catenatum TaxID=906689 RepID=A0A2I0VQ58_9ASPA|nr:hypothetical protein MA16_Dca027418 [Dendrobium catenatum]